MNNTFLHVDINAYFATMLQQENPRLRGKPVGVVKESKRTCVIASSKEAKALGVTTGCSAKEAKRLAPDIIFVPAAFDLYLYATKQLQALFSSVSPSVEVFSLDEAFIDITACRHIYPHPLLLARSIQHHIAKTLGSWVTCNVGIAETRLLAKIASESSPKGSIVEVTQENKDALLASVSFRDVCGVGWKLEKKLATLGVTTPYLIRFATDEELEQTVGAHWTKELRKISYGEETSQLSSIDRNPYMKSVGRSITGYSPCDDEGTIKRILYNLTEETSHKARKMQMAGREVSVMLWGENRFWHAGTTLKTALQQTKEIFGIVYDHLYSPWKRPFKVIKYGVCLSKLKPLDHFPLPLFPDQKNPVVHAVDAINERYGLFTVRSGILYNVPLIRPEVTGYLGDKIFQLKM